VRVIIGVLLICALAVLPAQAQTAASSSKADAVVDLINHARVNAGLLPLARSHELDSAAQGHSQDMVQHNYLDHTGSDGSEPQERATAAGYHVPPNSAWIVVEVISAISADPQGPVDWWLNDDQHARVLLNPRWREIGVGYAQGGDYGNYWTADVGCRPGVLPTVVFEGISYTHSEECGDPGVAATTVAAAPTATAVAPTPTAPIVAPAPTATIVRPMPTVSAAADSAARGNVVNVQWRGLEPASALDWIGLYQPGDADAAPISWLYVGCTLTPLDARPLGACNMYLPMSLAPATYEFRLFRENGYQRLAVSAPVHVS
jgi:cysteine-rich secretory family protein